MATKQELEQELEELEKELPMLVKKRDDLHEKGVRFHKSILALIEATIDKIIELGPLAQDYRTAKDKINNHTSLWESGKRDFDYSAPEQTRWEDFLRVNKVFFDDVQRTKFYLKPKVKELTSLILKQDELESRLRGLMDGSVDKETDGDIVKAFHNARKECHEKYKRTLEIKKQLEAEKEENH